MKYVNSGHGNRIPLLSLIAILSISLTVNLPGLAVSPLLGQLQSVFPHATELESQLLVVLPNFVIIPFILLGGRLSNPHNQLKILAGSLIIYAVCGVLFLFAKTMTELIILSCFLGVGCGPVIPLAGSLIAQNFSGEERQHQLGMKSGISNFMVIFATLFVGWVATIGWNLAFLVYLVPLVPLCLITYMSKAYIDKYKIVAEETTCVECDEDKEEEHKEEEAKTESDPIDTALNPPKKGVPAVPPPKYTGKQAIKLLLGVIGVYVTLTYAVLAIGDYLPFSMEHYGDNSTQVGVATALFYFAATCAGFSLTWCMKALGRMTPFVSIALCAAGLFCLGIFHHYIMYMIGAFAAGYGYGVMQPLIYEKTSELAPDSNASTRFFGYTLTGNYIGIAIAPFIVQLLEKATHDSGVNFSFFLNGIIVLVVLAIAIWKNRSFVFKVERPGKGATTSSASQA